MKPITASKWAYLSMKEFCSVFNELNQDIFEISEGVDFGWVPAIEFVKELKERFGYRFRVVKPTEDCIEVNGFKVPAPLSEEPELFTVYYLADPTSLKLNTPMHWDNKTLTIIS